MSFSILVVGSTGNTGQSVVETLSQKLAHTDGPLSSYTILALTRSARGETAQKLAQLPNVKVIEYNWVDITADWLNQHNVKRAFIASHNQPTQFAEETGFHLAALNAGVQYVVRISTTAANVRPDCPAYYPRQHWAIEATLASPEFNRMHWTSLQPNIFTKFLLGSAAEFVKEYKKTGKQASPLCLIAAEDAPVGVIEAADIGVFATALLLEEDTTKHNHAKYVLNGPEDITGRQIVDMVEKEIGIEVEDVRFKDMSHLDQYIPQDSESRSTLLTIRYAMQTGWDGKCGISTTSKEFLKISPPKGTAAEAFRLLIQE